MQGQIINANANRYDKFDLRTRRGRAAFVDAIWDRAIDVIHNTGRVSVAHFQRQLCIGYSSAVDLIDEMENRGVIGPKRQGWPTREVFIKTQTTKKQRSKTMAAVYRIEERKCATCRWWNGERGIEFRMNRPFYVKVGNSNSTCMAKSNGPASAVTVCPKWTRWEKI